MRLSHDSDASSEKRRKVPLQLDQLEDYNYKSQQVVHSTPSVYEQKANKMVGDPPNWLT